MNNELRPGRHLHAPRIALAAVFALTGIAAWQPASATPISIAGTTTTLTSTADRMISYRNQNHMWQTSDGATHVFINGGTASNGAALTLYSSFDGGATWTAMARLASSDSSSTSDGNVTNDVLTVTYSGAAGDVRYARLTYNSVQKTWSLPTTETVFSSTKTVATTPAVAADAMGRLWLAFTAQDKATSNYSIKMMRKDSDTAAWADTGFVFGTVDNLSNERSARPIATATGMGLIYTVHQNMYWAQRNNGWVSTATWQRSLIYSNVTADKDPYGTHYSAVADAQNTIHLVSVDGGRIIYSRLLNSPSAKWTTKPMTGNIQATYMQALISLGNLVVACNSGTQLNVYQSSDGGTNFTFTQLLTHPPVTGNISYQNPRNEAPTYSSSPIPMIQQYTAGSTTQKALFFSVPVVR